MTNEEAIKQIEMMIYYYESLDMDDDEEKDCEALNMAIRALEYQMKGETK